MSEILMPGEDRKMFEVQGAMHPGAPKYVEAGAVLTPEGRVDKTINMNNLTAEQELKLVVAIIGGLCKLSADALVPVRGDTDRSVLLDTPILLLKNTPKFIRATAMLEPAGQFKIQVELGNNTPEQLGKLVLFLVVELARITANKLPSVRGNTDVTLIKPQEPGA